MKASVVLQLALTSALGLTACNGDDPGGSGGSGGGEGGGGDVVCLDGAQQPTSACPVMPSGDLCEAAPNPACAPIRLIEVSDPEADGPCVRIVIDNDCDETLYSTTCIEFDDSPDGEPQWQCWVSTTPPGFDVDVGQCNATGEWTHWSGHSTGQLDTIEGTCNPS